MTHERPILGIDLGTSNTCVAFIDGEHVRVVTDERGRGVIPSVLCLNNRDEFVVGHFAKAQRVTNPFQTIYSAKRLIGWDFNAPALQQAIADLSFRVEDDGNNLPVCSLGERLIRPYEVSAQILIHARKLAESYLKQPVTEAVITVPAHFNDRQRKETMVAAQIAGLDVLRLINEPTAAALAYGYGYDNNAVVAIYDFGGGTFDISILEIESNVFEVLATGGDTYLGGDDINRSIAEYALNLFRDETGIDLFDDQLALQRVIDEAEKAKIALSERQETVINLPRIAPAIDFNAHLYCKLTRQTLEELARPFVERTLAICEQTFADARITAADITDIVLVGGSTRMPYVKERVSQYYNLPVNDSLHPDHVVAVGAAIQSHALTDVHNDILLVDVTPLSLGIESMGGLFSTVIPKNSKVPHRVSNIFTTNRDNQDSVRIKVFQGEERYTEENHFLGEFTLTGIRPAKQREPRIDVTFQLDSNGVLQVAAMDLDTQQVQSIEIKNVLGDPEVDLEAEAQRAAEREAQRQASRTPARRTGSNPAIRPHQTGSHSVVRRTGSQPAIRPHGTGSHPAVDPRRTGVHSTMRRTGSQPAIRPHTTGSHPAIRAHQTGNFNATAAGDPSSSGPFPTGSSGLLDVGTMIAGRYELRSQIGAGAFGAVYKAFDHTNRFEVALKLLLPSATLQDAAAGDRFLREGDVLASLSHPNLVAVYDYGYTDDGTLFMALEFVPGETLQDLLKREGTLSPARAVHIIRQCLLALGAAHEQSIVHRDLKPGNIMIFNSDRQRDIVKLIDFGVAKIIGDDTKEEMQDLTVVGKVLGTPRYIAPEQLAGAGNQPYSDIYSMGLIFYRMVSGQRAIKGETIAEILGAQVSPEPIVAEDDPLIPPGLFHVMRKSTEKTWRNRYLTTKDFVSDLDELDLNDLKRFQVPASSRRGQSQTASQRDQRSASTQTMNVQKPRGLRRFFGKK